MYFWISVLHFIPLVTAFCCRDFVVWPWCFALSLFPQSLWSSIPLYQLPSAPHLFSPAVQPASKPCSWNSRPTSTLPLSWSAFPAVPVYGPACPPEATFINSCLLTESISMFSLILCCKLFSCLYITSRLPLEGSLLCAHLEVFPVFSWEFFLCQCEAAMSKLFHKGLMWLQVFFSAKKQHTRPDSFNQLISVCRKLIGQTVCSWLVGTKTCSHTALCGIV